MAREEPSSSVTTRFSLWSVFLAVSGGVAFIFVTAIVLAFIGPIRQLDQDAAALQLLIRYGLPRGATLARSQAVLSSREVSRFVRTHGYNDPFADLPFQHVPSYTSSLGHSQAYPGGRMLEVNVSQDWDRGIQLYLFFDARGHLLRCAAHTYFHTAFG